MFPLGGVEQPARRACQGCWQAARVLSRPRVHGTTPPNRSSERERGVGGAPRGTGTCLRWVLLREAKHLHGTSVDGVEPCRCRVEGLSPPDPGMGAQVVERPGMARRVVRPQRVCVVTLNRPSIDDTFANAPCTWEPSLVSSRDCTITHCSVLCCYIACTLRPRLVKNKLKGTYRHFAGGTCRPSPVAWWPLPWRSTANRLVQ